MIDRINSVYHGRFKEDSLQGQKLSPVECECRLPISECKCNDLFEATGSGISRNDDVVLPRSVTGGKRGWGWVECHSENADLHEVNHKHLFEKCSRAFSGLE